MADETPLEEAARQFKIFAQSWADGDRVDDEGLTAEHLRLIDAHLDATKGMVFVHREPSDQRAID